MSVIWPQIGSNIAGQYDDDLFGNSISLSDDGTIVAIGAIWYDGGSIDFTASTNLVTITGHNYSYNDEIGFAGIVADTGTKGIGLGDGETYYVINNTTDTFQLSSIQGASVFDIITDGTAADGYTFTAATNLVTKTTAHGLIYGATVSFTGVSGAIPIVNSTPYYVIFPTTNTFQLSASLPPTLSTIDILGDGSATTTVTVDSDNQSNKGRVQIFKNTDGTWGQLGNSIDGENYRDKFGQSVALNAAGTRVASGARGAVDESGIGRVRVFEYDGSSTWDLLGDNIDPVDTGVTVVLDVSESTVDYTSHGYNNNDAIMFKTLNWDVNELSTWTIYYVVNKTDDTFQLSSTYGGSAITFTGSDDNAAVIENNTFHIGWSISLNNTGDIVAVGSPRSNAEAGLATLYKLGGSTWTKMGRSIGGQGGSGFGLSISLNASGSIVAVGAIQTATINYGTPNPDGGYVGIYENSDITDVTKSWTQKGPLIHAVDEETYEIDGGTENTLTRTNHGFENGDEIAFATITTTTQISAYTGYYVISATTNSFQLSLSEGSTTAIGLTTGSATRNHGDHFGYSVSLNDTGDIVAIGAIYKNISGSSVGQVKIYKYNSGTWVQLGSAINGSTAGDQLGYSVALNPEADGIDGNTFVAIGVPGVNGSDSGHVEIHTYDSSAWSLLYEKIEGDTGGDKFGQSVSMDKDGLIVAGGATIWGGYADTYDITAGSTNLFTFTDHGFVDDDRISFDSFVDTGGVDVGTPYYVKRVDNDTFQLSETTTTNGGAGTTLPLNNNGTATRTSYGVGYAKVNTVPTVPGAPTITGATPLDKSIEIVFTEGTYNGAPAIDYEYSITPGMSDVSIGQTTSPFTITDLSNGTSYVIELKAVTASLGNSSYSSEFGPVTPVAVPSAPTIDSITANSNGSVSVAFTPGAANGSAITNYKYKIDSGSWTARDPVSVSSPITISSGLSLGVSQGIMILAVNSAGDGATSDAVSVTPATAPDAPIITDDTTGDNTSAIIHFTAGASNNGRDITNYKYSVDGAGTVELGNTTTPFTITDLNNGQTYSITLYAYNAMGWSTVSAAKNVTPRAVPDSPIITGAVPGNSKISMIFTVGNDNDSDIIRYEYSIDTGNNWDTVTLITPTTPVGDITPGTTASFDAGSLINGDPYVVMLRAVNANGSGQIASSSSVIPVTTPSEPTNVEVFPGNEQAIVTYLNSDDGGSTILYYQYSLDNNASPLVWAQFMAHTMELVPRPIITGLTNNKDPPYQVTVRAVNSVGGGTPSSPAIELVPLPVPGAPYITGLIPGNASASVEFNAADAYGTIITTYEYSTDNGSTWTARSSGTTESPLEILNLNNGQSYQVRIRAVNSSGGGTSSNAFTAEPESEATAPTITSVTPGDGQMSIYFNPGAVWGSPAINYQYTFDDGENWDSMNPVQTTSPLIITGLTNGHSYTVKIRTLRTYGPDPFTSSPHVVIPATFPDAPSINVVSGNLSAIITITDGANNGRDISNYQYSKDNGSTWTISDPASIESPLTLTGLTFEHTYQVKLKSYNQMGWSPESSMVSVTVGTYPDPPAITSVTPDDQRVTIVFTAGADNGAAISNYQYSVDNGSTWANRNPVSTQSPLVISGLINNQEYQIKLRAVSSIGYGNTTSMYPATPFSDIPKPALTVGPNNTIIVPTYGLEILTNGTPAANRTMRTIFIKSLLTDNATLINGNKLLIDTKKLLGESTIITKQYVRILNTYTSIPNLPTVERFRLLTLEANEGIYLPLDDIYDSIILQLSEGNFNWFMKFVKATSTHYHVYEEYENINTPLTHVKTIGDSGNYRYFSYIIDSVSGEYNPPPSPVPICFPKGTPVSTDQGDIEIEKIIPNFHTIRGKQIMVITKTIPHHTYLISIEQDAFERNIPSKTTQISKEHKLVYKGNLIKAKELVNLCKGVNKIPYDGKPLYNVLMKNYEYMMINNLTCETLHPDSIMSQIYNGNFNYTEQNAICSELTKILESNDTPAYNKLCKSIRYFEKEKTRRRNVDIRVGVHGIGSNIYAKQSK